jgi:hypothetical protein
MTLALTPVPLEGVPDASADARMIGLLAWAMLTGKVLVGDPSEKALIELRPDLAQRVAADTVAMIGSKHGIEPPDVQNFLAVIANGDALKQAEVEIARIQAELVEERRIERETLAAERLAEREKFDAEKQVYVAKAAEIEQRLADDRAEFERRIAEEEELLARTERRSPPNDSVRPGALELEERRRNSRQHAPTSNGSGRMRRGDRGGCRVPLRARSRRDTGAGTDRRFAGRFGH